MSWRRAEQCCALSQSFRAGFPDSSESYTARQPEVVCPLKIQLTAKYIPNRGSVIVQLQKCLAIYLLLLPVLHNCFSVFRLFLSTLRCSGWLLLKVLAARAPLLRDLVTKLLACAVKLAPGTRCPRTLLGSKGVWRVQDCLGHGLPGLGGWCRTSLHFFQASCGFVVCQ